MHSALSVWIWGLPVESSWRIRKGLTCRYFKKYKLLEMVSQCVITHQSSTGRSELRIDCFTIFLGRFGSVSCKTFTAFVFHTCNNVCFSFWSPLFLSSLILHVKWMLVGQSVRSQPCGIEGSVFVWAGCLSDKGIEVLLCYWDLCLGCPQCNGLVVSDLGCSKSCAAAARFTCVHGCSRLDFLAFGHLVGGLIYPPPLL